MRRRETERGQGETGKKNREDKERAEGRGAERPAGLFSGTWSFSRNGPPATNLNTPRIVSLQNDPNPARNRNRFRTDFGTDSEPIPNRFRTDSEPMPNPNRFGTDLEPIPNRFRTDSERKFGLAIFPRIGPGGGCLLWALRHRGLAE